MLTLVRELLEHPDDYTLKPEALRELLSRLHELLERETAKRASHRPRENTGAFVATLYEACGSLARAKRLVAKAERKTLVAVARAYERHQKQKRQK
jgi:DNA-binding response OmpR family regulator